MDQIEVFKVKAGTIDFGKDYEQAVVAKTALNLTIDATVENFKISSNDDDFGSFDDVVVEVTTTTGTENFALQLKHLDKDKSKDAWKTELNKSKGNFVLQKFFDTYKKLTAKNMDNYKFILFTNIDFPFNVDEQLDVKIDSHTFTVKISKSEVYPLFKSNESSKCHKFKVILPSELKIYEDFFEHFFIYSKQGSMHQVKDEILKSFNLIIPAVDDKYTLKYLEFIGKWATQKRKNNKLTKGIMRNVLTLNFILDDIELINFQNNLKLDWFQKIISKFDCVVFNKEVLETVRSIRINLQTNAPDAEVIKKLYQLHTLKNENLQHSIISWLTQQSLLIINLSKGTIKVIETFRPSNCILIKSDSEVALSPHIAYFQKLSDLEQYSDLYTELIQALQCTISKDSFSLEYLINCDENLKKSVTTNDLLKMSLQNYKIKDPEHKFSTLYMPRFFKRNVIDVKRLSDLDPDKLIFISNVENKTKIQRFLRENIYFNDLMEAKKQFFKLVNSKSNYKEYHHLRFVEDDLLEWVESVNGVRGIRQYIIQYIIDGDSLNEETFCKQLDCGANIKLICDEPGMGKTWLLKSLKDNLSSKYWTVFLSCAEIDEFCNQSPKPKTKQDLIAFLLDTKYKDLNTTHKNIINIVLNNNTPKVAYFWDALDEIEPHQVDFVINMIKNICSLDKCSLHFTTSRKHLKHKLEEEFCVLAQSLSQFGVQEQKEYLEKRLKTCDKEEKNNLIENILKYFDFIKGNDFLGIPLQIYMLTELFQIDDSKYSELLKQQLVITDLYEYFFEEKLKAFYKNNTNGIKNTAQSNYEKREFQSKKNFYYKCYEKMSLKLLFGANLLKKMKINLDDAFSDLADNLEHVGIMQKDPTWRFIHSSYAEYFAACFFVKKIEKVRTLKKIWFNASNNNVRFFFDLLTAKGSQPHLAVLYQNVEFLKSCKDINCKDKGGRNLLHLACSWGDRYSILSVQIVKKMCLIKTYVINDWDVETGEKNDNYFKMLNYLLENVTLGQKDILFGMTEIDYATNSSCLLSVAAVKKALNEDIFDLSTPRYALSLLYYTISLGYDTFLVAQRNLDFISKTKLKSGISFINLALWKGHVDTYNLLLKYGDICENQDIIVHLHRACEHGQVKTVELLLKHGANCNAANKDGETPLHVACEEGHVETAELLLKHGAKCNAVNKDRETPLYGACENGHVETAELLLKYEAICNAADNDGWTPLHVACRYGHLETAELLLKHGANCNAADQLGRTPLHVAWNNGHVETAELLLKHGAKCNAANEDGKTPLHVVCENDQVKTAELLLKHGADCNAADKYGKTPLHVACEEGHVETAELLLKHGANCNAVNKDGETPLYEACENAHVETAELLLKHGAKCNAANEDGETPLHVVCENDQVKTAELLLKHGADCNAADKYGKTPLHVVCQNGHVETAELLLKHGANCKAPSKYGETPLYLACFKGHAGTAELLLKHGANCNAANKDGETPLHVACEEGHVETAELLLKYEAICNATDNDGWTPLHVACIKGHVETTELLLKHGANCNAVTRYGKTPLHVACRYGHLETAELLLKYEAIYNAADNDGWTPLHVACRYGQVKTAELLLKHGANCNAITRYGKTPLHVTCRYGHLETAELVLKHGADCNAADKVGWTPLYEACFYGHVETAELLLKHGTNCKAVHTYYREAHLYGLSQDPRPK